jgi:2-octaprenyl-6-methoxyphenol hydroxylase
MAKQKNIQTDILISGGGIAGLTLALLLSEAGVQCAVIDPFPPAPLKDTEISGRTVALMQSSLNILRAAGIEDIAEEYGAPLKIMRLHDDSIGGKLPVISDFEATQIGMDAYGYNIPNNILRAAVFEKAKAAKNITLLTPEKLLDYKIAGNTVEAKLESGQTLRARLMVGADGRNSLVRKIAEIKTQKREYGQAAITFVINHSKAHQDVATEFHRPHGPLALVPLPGNQSSVVWVEKQARAEELMKIKKQEFESLFQDATNNVLGAITLETNPESWPLCSIHAKSLVASHVALVAEAAHVLSPITAQGLNLSLRDVAALAETLIDGARLGQDMADATLLTSYEKRRRLDMASRVHGVDSMMRLVSQEHPAIKGLRRAGLKFVDGFTPLKTFAMEQGLAPPLGQGRLAKGEAL